jgi:nucleoside-diphosphate-sugar epimerase
MLLGRRRARFLSAVDKLTESVAVRSDRIQRELGFRPAYDLQRGWRETVNAMKTGW